MTVHADEAPCPQADALFESYFEKLLALNPTYASSIGDNRFNDKLEINISDQHRNDMRKLYLETQHQLTLLPQCLTASQQISVAVLNELLDIELERLKFPDHLMPISTIVCFPDEFATECSGEGNVPLTSLDELETFLGRMKHFSDWVDLAIANMDKGLTTGVTMTAVVIEAAIKLIERPVAESDVAKSIFLQAFDEDGLDSKSDRYKSLKTTYEQLVKTSIYPAYQKLISYLKDSYLPKTRQTVGWNRLPNGENWYRFLVKSWTTTKLRPDDIHQIGLKEVERIGPLYEKANQEAKKEEAPERYDNEAELLAAYQHMLRGIEPGLNKLFGFAPKSPLTFKGSHRGAYYRPGSNDGTRPGMFMIYTADIESSPSSVSEALFLHEAIPGHHYQISLQYERDLPKFRKNYFNYAFAEGWGLYAESLGNELGLYKNAHDRVDQLHSELFRAIRLVVDTGIHSKGWSQQQALAYFEDKLGYRPTREVIRYIGWPAQALTYKVGERFILDLKAKTLASNDKKKDVKAFHRFILETGPMPLKLIDQKHTTWLQSTAAE